MTYINIYLDELDERRTVRKSDYVTAKTKQMREFGYTNLTRKEVEEQLDLLLAGENWTNVIGGFIENDRPEEPR